MDVINVINLFHREERLISFCNQMRIQKTAFRIWNGIESFHTSAENVSAAHKQIIRWAKEKNMSRVCVFEDDAIFSHEKSYEYFLSQVPEVYDIFFCMLYNGEIKEGKVLNGFSGMTGYIVHEKAYDYFLSIPDTQHIDRGLGERCFEKEFYVCLPYIARQSGGYSSNLKMQMNYQEIEKNMTFFEGND